MTAELQEARDANGEVIASNDIGDNGHTTLDKCRARFAALDRSETL
ncbi:MAG: hypothetical protein KGS44_05130 [Alphaproteobacteria bacterium]|nr:hypothetical protein [Alphaproteobacteria bacterium]